MGTMRLPMKRLIAAEMVFKRRMRQSGNVDIPQRALLAVLGGDEEEA